MKSLAALLTTSILLAGSGAVLSDPIEDRQALMEERGDIMQVIGPMAQGEQPYDAETALEALDRMNENAQAATDVAAYWPEGSEGGDSTAAVWENMGDFQERHDQFATDVAAAVEAQPQDLDAFRAVFGPMAANCGSCHENYRQQD